MPNLLLNPALWRDANGFTPPQYWNAGTGTYEYNTGEGVGGYFRLDYIGDEPAPGDVLRCTFTQTNEDGLTLYVLVNSGEALVSYPFPPGALDDVALDAPAGLVSVEVSAFSSPTETPPIYGLAVALQPYLAGLVAEDDTATTDQGVPVSIPVLENDTFADAPVVFADLTSFDIQGAPSNGSAEVSGEEIVYTPNPSFSGVDTFGYIITLHDGEGFTSDEATVTVTVNPGPEPASTLPNCECTDDTSDHRTLGQLRTAVLQGLGFVDVLTTGPARTLGEMRADVFEALNLGNAQTIATRTLGQIAGEIYKMAGFADMVTPTAGTTAELHAFVNQAQQILWKRLEVNGEGAPPAWMADPADPTTLDGAAVQTIAVGLAKAHYGMPDAKAYQDYVEQYLSGLAQREAPVSQSQVNAALIRARDTVWNRDTPLDPMTADGDSSGIHYVPIELQAIASLKARMGHKDADLHRRDYERYVTEAEKRMPPDATNVVTLAIQSAQTTLYRRYSVLRTERFFSWPLTEGVNLYDLPDNAEACDKKLDPRELTWVGIERDGVWNRLICGIPPELYTLESRSWPVRYEIRQCIEVWPTPDTTEGRLIIKGHFKPEPFTADNHRTTIDCEPVFLQAMVTVSLHYKRDHRDYAQRLDALLQNLTAGAHLTRRYIPGTRTLIPEHEPTWDVESWP